LSSIAFIFGIAFSIAIFCNTKKVLTLLYHIYFCSPFINIYRGDASKLSEPQINVLKMWRESSDQKPKRKRRVTRKRRPTVKNQQTAVTQNPKSTVVADVKKTKSDNHVLTAIDNLPYQQRIALANPSMENEPASCSSLCQNTILEGSHTETPDPQVSSCPFIYFTDNFPIFKETYNRLQDLKSDFLSFNIDDLNMHGITPSIYIPELFRNDPMDEITVSNREQKDNSVVYSPSDTSSYFIPNVPDTSKPIDENSAIQMIKRAFHDFWDR